MTESLLIVLLVVAIGAAAWFAYRAQKAQEAAIEAKARLEGVNLIREERDRAVAERDALREKAGKLEAELASEKGAAVARAEAAEAQAKALKEQFSALATQALDASQQRFLSLANETFEKHKVAAQGGVKEALAPTHEQLTRLTEHVTALEKARLQDKSAIGQQMLQIATTLKDTQNVTGKLANALRQSPKARGRWGEQTLRNVLELSGLAPNVDFTEQVSTTDGEGARLRPDVVINLPGGRCIVVDSKVALSAYLDAIEATDEVTREALLKKHAQEMRAHVKGLSSKEYWKHNQTADFVVMFVPGDNFLSAASERDPGLMDDAFGANVIITTPSTMVALAKSVAFGWRQEQSAKNAQEIADLGRELYRRMGTMVDKLGKVGNAIESSVKSYSDLVASVESRLLPQTRKFKELGAGDSDEIASPKQIEQMPRQVAAPEQLELTPPPENAKKRGAG